MGIIKRCEIMWLLTNLGSSDKATDVR